MTRYMVIVEGAGEWNTDYSVKEYDAESPQEAADKAVADGYGTASTAMTLFVTRRECVTKFEVSEKPTAYEVAETPWEEPA